MGGRQNGKRDGRRACSSRRFVQEIGRRDSTPRRRRRRALWPQRVWSGLDGGRSERGLERCGNGSRCRCQQGKTERRPLLHGLGSSGVSTIGRVQERHGPAGPRVEGLAKSGGTIANLRSRREELCKDGKVPERGYPIGSQGCRSHETSGDGDRTSIPNQLLRTLFDLMPRTKNSLVGGSQVLESISSKVNLRLNRA